MPGTGLWRYGAIGWNPSERYRVCADAIVARVSSRIAAYPAVRCGDHDGLGEPPAHARTPEARSDVEAFHFAHTGVQRAHRHAAGRFVAHPREQQAAGRRRVVAWKTGQLVREP